ncbi:DMT family transporter [Maritimibacter dapengensis]|uniref:DMT family transporter n=1 Tax=Maritimibacter dapengensis TaxID=2836868 RepID=A0ABS6T394_9RHOB|nr:DMT family transporter [Maritimibacter dapengensis]MBV7379720.1 DMT family transporter [Maritimibacter dapengensis]
MDIRAIVMGLVFALAWSSAFTSARVIVADAPPMTALAIRFVISGLMAMGLARAMGQRIQLTRGQWVSVVVFGVCQNALYLGLNFIAMQTIEAGFASIIASTMPLVVGLLGWIVFRDRLAPLAVAGLVIGFIGVALIMGSRITGGVDMYGLSLCVIAAIALAVATLSVRTASGGGNLLMVVGLQMLVGAVALAPFAAALEPFEVNWNPTLLFAFAYTTLVPGLAATWIWFELVKRIGAVRAATFHFLNPFFGVAIAAVLLGERLGWLDVIGVAIVTVGILAVQLAKQTPKSPVNADRAAT